MIIQTNLLVVLAVLLGTTTTTTVNAAFLPSSSTSSTSRSCCTNNQRQKLVVPTRPIITSSQGRRRVKETEWTTLQSSIHRTLDEITDTTTVTVTFPGGDEETATKQTPLRGVDVFGHAPTTSSSTSSSSSTSVSRSSSSSSTSSTRSSNVDVIVEERSNDDDDSYFAYNNSNHGRYSNEECSLSDNENLHTLADDMAESIDIEREGKLLEALDSYNVVSILTTTAAVAGMEGLTVPEYLPQQLLHYGAVIAATCAAFCGMYSTVIFSLSSAYGKAAIGRSKDDLFMKFMDDSSSLRAKGFDAFMCALGLFLSEEVVICSEQLSREYVPPFLVGSLIFGSFIYRDWKQLMKTASPIFADQSPFVSKRKQK